MPQATVRDIEDRLRNTHNWASKEASKYVLNSTLDIRSTMERIVALVAGREPDIMFDARQHHVFVADVLTSAGHELIDSRSEQYRKFIATPAVAKFISKTPKGVRGPAVLKALQLKNFLDAAACWTFSHENKQIAKLPPTKLRIVCKQDGTINYSLGKRMVSEAIAVCAMRTFICYSDICQKGIGCTHQVARSFVNDPYVWNIVQELYNDEKPNETNTAAEADQQIAL